MPKLSVCIPCYEMHGVGVDMLKRSLVMLEQQSFPDFEVVVSDNSGDESIGRLCGLGWNLNIAYFKNPRIGMAANTNFAMQRARGDILKILYQDDYLAHGKALEDIVNKFSLIDNWLITACSNNLKPYYSPDKNTLGSPSVLTVWNRNLLLFDERYSWMLDMDLYRRLYAKFGPPKILDKVNVVMGLGRHQHTNYLTDQQKYEEHTSFAANGHKQD